MLKIRITATALVGVLSACAWFAASAGPAPGTTKVPPFIVNPPTSLSTGGTAAIATDDAGNLTAVWEGPPNTAPAGYGIFFRRFYANGVPQGGSNRVSTPLASARCICAVAASRTTGNFVVAWEEDEDGLGQLPPVKIIFARTYTHAGIPVVTVPVLIAPQSSSGTIDSLQIMGLMVAMNRSGEFVVGWSTFQYLESLTGPGNSFTVNIARYNALGLRQGPVQVLSNSNSASLAGLGIADDGHFMASWSGINPPGTPTRNLSLACYTSAGNLARPPLQLFTSATPKLNFSGLAQGDDGSIVLAWEWVANPGSTAGGLSAELFDSSCNQKAPAFVIHQSADEPDDYGVPMVAIDTAHGQFAIFQTFQNCTNPGSYVCDLHLLPVQPQLAFYSLTGAPLSPVESAAHGVDSGAGPFGNVGSGFAYDSISAPAFDGSGNLWLAWGESDPGNLANIWAASYYGAPVH